MVNGRDGAASSAVVAWVDWSAFRRGNGDVAGWKGMWSCKRSVLPRARCASASAAAAVSTFAGPGFGTGTDSSDFPRAASRRTDGAGQPSYFNSSGEMNDSDAIIETGDLCSSVVESGHSVPSGDTIDCRCKGFECCGCALGEADW